MMLHKLQLVKDNVSQLSSVAFQEETLGYNEFAKDSGLQQGKSEGFDSCDRPSNLTQTGFKLSIFQSGNA